MSETLLRRNESKGSAYPLYLEKLIFLASMVGFVFLNQILWSSIDVMWYQWLASVGLALSMLILNELIGRTIQVMRARK
ncbi:MAG: hypothetical protein VX115_00865 [Candidatus Thermoplasmatota archaeon]|jgi:hypothetical protein|nr:hypothetical protein [Rhodobiaceae bacterium]MEC8106267.1 hypothetical protein [Candidatus Thermoplasmatota archaeon]MEC8588586.1 hypothetical protein [Candidatus Thermoplasmatota archaeon]